MQLWFKKEQTKHKQPLSHGLMAWLRNHPSLGHLNRHTVAGAVGLGLLVAFIPIPIQMILLTILSLVFRVNLAVAILVTWISNPITFIPFNILIYKLGAWIINSIYPDSLPSANGLILHWQHFGMFWQEFTNSFSSLWKSYLLGLLIVSIISAIVGYLLVQCIWLLCHFIQRRME